MTGLNHLLVATDGSEGSLHAAVFAGNLARKLGAKVTVLCVQDEDSVPSHAWGAGDLWSGAPDGLKTIEQVRVSLEQHARENEISEAATALGDLAEEPDKVFIWGHPSEQICKFAGDNSVDLIVIGSHGRSGLKRAFLGSVSQAVANRAPCPVTIIR